MNATQILIMFMQIYAVIFFLFVMYHWKESYPAKKIGEDSLYLSMAITGWVLLITFIL